MTYINIVYVCQIKKIAKKHVLQVNKKKNQMFH